MRLGVLLVAAAMAAMGATTVTQSKITAGDGTHLATGKITVTASAAFLAADGTAVDTTALTVNVINGAFSVNLEPNDTGVPSGTSYTAVWQLMGAAQRTEHWVVPTSGTGLGLLAVRVNTAPAVGVTLNPSQLTQSGASVGQALCWLGTAWGPGSCGGGASWVVNSVPCSSSVIFDLSLGNIQTLSLSCNVTSASVLNLAANSVVIFRICQTAAYGFTWPAAVTGGVSAGASGAGKCAAQWFYSVDGVHLQTQGLGVINQ